ncbi:MAG TPA: hypothetical protein VNK82_08670 [Terriglobales bacterium]|nr:hypothetical protein [Terriglobales bacterium]
MIFSLLFVLVSLAGVAVLFRALRGQAAAVQSLDEVESLTQPVDLEAFRNLMDPSQEAFLRERLPASEFRQVQRERLRAALEYVGRAAHNAALLVRVGEAARASADPEVARSAQDLVNRALQMRLYAQMARVQIGLLIAFPQARLSLGQVIESYTLLRERVAHLVRLQQPAYAARIVSAL